MILNTEYCHLYRTCVAAKIIVLFVILLRFNLGLLYRSYYSGFLNIYKEDTSEDL